MSEDNFRGPSSEDLARLFPAAYAPRTAATLPHFAPYGNKWAVGHKKAAKILSTRARVILSLELRGQTKVEIAEHLKISPLRVSQITRAERYILAREEVLSAADQDFLNMKPEAMKALRSGLGSRDENTALRASETWMRAAGFMQYGKGQQNAGVTAEDIAAQLLQVNVQVNIATKE